MVDNEYDGSVRGVRYPSASSFEKQVDLVQHRPLLPGGKSFSLGHKHWLVEFKTSGNLEGGKGERLTEIILKEISPFSRSLEKPEGETFHVFVNPEIECNPVAMKHNGHSSLLLNDKPNFKAIAPQLGERLRNQIVYVRNKRQFESVVQRQMMEEGFPEFSKLFFDLVDVKEQALEMNLSVTNKIIEVWRSLGIEAKADEKRSGVLIETFREGLALMREKLPADALVFPLTTGQRKPADQIIVKSDQKPQVQETLSLDFNAPLTAIEQQASKDVPSSGQGISRKSTRRSSAEHVAIREHVVCIRNPTVREMSAGSHNLGGIRVLHISSRTSNNIFDLNSDLVLFHRKFEAGEGSREKANAFRNAITDIYELAGYRRYTDEPPKVVVPRKPGRVRKVRPSEATSIQKQLAVTLSAVAAVPLDRTTKMMVLKALSLRMDDTAKVGVIDKDSSLRELFSEALAQVVGHDSIGEISLAPVTPDDAASGKVVRHTLESSMTETNAAKGLAHAVKASAHVVEVPTHLPKDIKNQLPEPDPTLEVSLESITERARVIVSKIEAEIDQLSGHSLTILNTPYATLCARSRDMHNVVQDLMNESALARAQAEILLAHAAMKENAARWLAQSPK